MIWNRSGAPMQRIPSWTAAACAVVALASPARAQQEPARVVQVKANPTAVTLHLSLAQSPQSKSQLAFTLRAEPALKSPPRLSALDGSRGVPRQVEAKADANGAWAGVIDEVAPY